MKKANLLYLVFMVSTSTFAEVPRAYVTIAADEGIPASVLWTIATIESNAKLDIGWYPWPWTLNVAGKSRYFEDRESACKNAMEAIDEHGPYSVDIGFTQNNWGWNGIKYFSTPCDALDPVGNLQAAAKILRKCFDDRGDWVEAAGCYHRPAGGTPAEKYKSTFSKRWDRTL